MDNVTFIRPTQSFQLSLHGVKWLETDVTYGYYHLLLPYKSGAKLFKFPLVKTLHGFCLN